MSGDVASIVNAVASGANGADAAAGANQAAASFKCLGV